MKWKHWVSWVLLLLMVLAIAGCEKKPVYDTSPEFNPETDNQYFWRCAYGFEVAESPDGYYYLSHIGYLHFVDKNTMEDIVLCSKPNCRHEENAKLDGADPLYRSCEGFIEGAENCIFYHKGNLYVVERTTDIEGMTIADRHFYLLEISLDGAQRKRIHEFDVTTNDTGKGNPGIIDCMMHRGRFYYSVCYGINDYVFFYCYDMQTKKTTLLHEGGSVQQVDARGDFLYLLLRYEENDVWELWRYTISTGEKELVGDTRRTFYENGMCEQHYELGEDGIANKFWRVYLSYEEEELFSADCPDTLYFFDANDSYFVAEWETKNTYQDVTSGKIYSYEEYRERVTTLQQSPDLYVNCNPTLWVFDSRTMEVLMQIPMPEGAKVGTNLRGNMIFVFDRFSENAFTYGDLSVPAENFEWKQSERVN